ncbi:MAG: PorP/SprF family type IX secretion system membrane protein [Bacteroidota bacterium]
MKTDFYRFLILVCFFNLTVSLSAQDIHFSQYYLNPLNINPALTGVFEEDMRFMGHYRSQWQSVPVSYLTFTGAFDTKLNIKAIREGYFAVGGTFNFDQAGDGDLSLAQLNLMASYTRALSDQIMMTGGFQLGTGQRSFDPNQLTWANQYDGDIFNAGLSSGENFANTSVGFLDVGAGLNFFISNDDRKSFANVGLGVNHVNRPRQEFNEQSDARLPVRYTLYAYGNTNINDRWALLLHAQGQLQDVATELVTGPGVHFRVRDEPGNQLAVRFLLSYRFSGLSDAIVPIAELHYQSWRLGLSYDINISDYNRATNGQGGPELALWYTITKVKPLKSFKACPIF